MCIRDSRQIGGGKVSIGQGMLAHRLHHADAEREVDQSPAADQRHRDAAQLRTAKAQMQPFARPVQQLSLIHIFNLISFWGLTLVYLFFQIPLMILIITPALEGLKREWREAAAILGATGPQYWRMVALPILFPSLIGTLALLFAHAFGAVATAYALTGSSMSIVPIMLFAQIRGDVLGDPHLGYALAFGMIVVTGIANFIYIWLRTRSERWMK